MGRRETVQGVRMAMFLNLLHRWESAELNQGEAAALDGERRKNLRSQRPGHNHALRHPR